MDWPLASHYTAMLQNPQIALLDPELQKCRVRRDTHNQPLGISGRFAVVYEAILPDNQGRKALRAFTSDRQERTDRYRLLSEYLAQVSVAALVGFEYCEPGIRVINPKAGRARQYPLVTMEWVDGCTLFEWVQARCAAGDAEGLRAMSDRWVQLVRELEAAQIAHGDLQHGNVLVTPGDELKLVDYDGMCVPSLEGRLNLELGMLPYQHPRRDEHTPLSPRLDRFSALLIHLALRALAASPGLWTQHVESQGYERLLFQSQDLEHPGSSELCQALHASPDAEVGRLTIALLEAFAGALDDVPRLEDVLGRSTSAPPSIESPEVPPAPEAAPAPVPAQTTAAAPRWVADPSEAAATASLGVADPSGGVSALPAWVPAPGGVAAVSPAWVSDSGGAAAASPTRVSEPVGTAPAPVVRAQEPLPHVAPMLLALRDHDLNKFCEHFEPRLIREHQDQFGTYRKLVEEWTKQRFRAKESLGLRQPLGRESLTGGADYVYDVHWAWPSSRFTEACVLGLTRQAVTSSHAPEDLELLSLPQTVMREYYENGRGMVIYADRSQVGAQVVVWALLDLGFVTVFSEPLTLGVLRPAARNRKSRGW